jgi:cytochrome b involved in lipid metabolism
VAGRDATKEFKDVGHSDEAREVLDGLFIGPVRPY